MSEITLLEDIEADRMDGVANPANGFPVLMLKSLTDEKESGVPDNTNMDAEGTEPATPVVKKDEKTSEPAGETAKAQGEAKPDMASLIKEAVAEAMKPLVERAEALEGELAKVKATPIPGGPAISAPPGMRTQERTDKLAKVAYYERQAEVSDEPDLKREYQARAAAARADAGLPST